MGELRCNESISLTEEQFEILDSLLPLKENRYAPRNNSYDIELEPMVEKVILQHSDLQTLRSQLESIQSRLETVKFYEKLFVVKGYARQMLVLQVLAEIQRPCSLQYIHSMVITRPQYHTQYKSQSITPVRGAIKVLCDLGYVDRLERAIYRVSKKGEDFLHMHPPPERPKKGWFVEKNRIYNTYGCWRLIFLFFSNSGWKIIWIYPDNDVNNTYFRSFHFHFNWSHLNRSHFNWSHPGGSGSSLLLKA